jgi:hypothetical protein
VLELDRLPQSLLVIGGGYIGCELGQMFARAGVIVTIVDIVPILGGRARDIDGARRLFARGRDRPPRGSEAHGNPRDGPQHRPRHFGRWQERDNRGRASARQHRTAAQHGELLPNGGVKGRRPYPHGSGSRRPASA